MTTFAGTPAFRRMVAVGVAQVVRPDAQEFRCGDEWVEVLAVGVGVDGCAVWLSEHG